MRVNLIVGPKGTGKTKRFTDMINQRVVTSGGSVVCIEKGDISRFTVSHKARLIDTDEFDIKGVNELYGLIAGSMASNYDITDIFVDATFRIIGDKDPEKLKILVDKLKLIHGDVTVTLTVSCNREDLPESALPYIV